MSGFLAGEDLKGRGGQDTVRGIRNVLTYEVIPGEGSLKASPWWIVSAGL